jgi:endo-1,4-beta-xylanase
VKDHFRAVIGRYGDRVYAWDVVNEAVETKEPYFRETDWTRVFGFNTDFVKMAFEFAREAAPDALHVYNDFLAEKPAKRERVLMLLEDLKKAGTPADVVGIQGHWEVDDVPYEDIEQSIIEYHQAGARTAVTELDLDVMSRKKYWNMKTRAEAEKQNPYPERCPDEVLQRQAEQYGRLFELFARHRDKVERVTFWGLTDGHSWLNNWPWPRRNYALPFDREAQAKPAVATIREALSSTGP